MRDHGNNVSNRITLPSFAAGVNGSEICFDPALTVDMEECLSLIGLYNTTNGPSRTTNTNWLVNPDIDSWYGVTVSDISGDGHITSICLGDESQADACDPTKSGNNLVGTLTTDFGNLPWLTQLILSNNTLN